MSVISKYRSVLVAGICGVFVSLTTGLFERDVISILEVKYYGYPLIWRITNLNGPTEYVLTNFTLDTVVWVAAALFSFLLFDRITNYLQRTSKTNTHLGPQNSVGAKKIRMFLVYFLVLAFVMKGVGEVVHEVLGHGLFVLLFGGRILSVNISLLWPYRLSSVDFSGSFEAWQRPWIDGGGILVCLVTSCIIQTLLLWKVKNWRLAVPMFWLAFWTFLNPVGYLIIGGIKPFGDIAQLIAESVLSQSSSLAIGLILFAVAFFSSSKIFNNMVKNAGVIRNTRRPSVALSFFWLIIPFITLMAITGLGFLSAYSLLLIAISFVPSLVALLLARADILIF